MENFISTKICYNKLGCKIHSITIPHLINELLLLLLQYECRTCVRIWMKVNVKYTKSKYVWCRVFLTVRFLSSRWRMKSDIEKKISLFVKVYVVKKKKPRKSKTSGISSSIFVRNVYDFSDKYGRNMNYKCKRETLHHALSYQSISLNKIITLSKMT